MILCDSLRSIIILYRQKDRSLWVCNFRKEPPTRYFCKFKQHAFCLVMIQFLIEYGLSELGTLSNCSLLLL